MAPLRLPACDRGGWSGSTRPARRSRPCPIGGETGRPLQRASPGVLEKRRLHARRKDLVGTRVRPTRYEAPNPITSPSDGRTAASTQSPVADRVPCDSKRCTHAFAGSPPSRQRSPHPAYAEAHRCSGSHEAQRGGATRMRYPQNSGRPVPHEAPGPARSSDTAGAAFFRQVLRAGGRATQAPAGWDRGHLGRNSCCGRATPHLRKAGDGSCKGCKD